MAITGVPLLEWPQGAVAVDKSTLLEICDGLLAASEKYEITLQQTIETYPFRNEKGQLLAPAPWDHLNDFVTVSLTAAEQKKLGSATSTPTLMELYQIAEMQPAHSVGEFFLNNVRDLLHPARRDLANDILAAVHRHDRSRWQDLNRMFRSASASEEILDERKKLRNLGRHEEQLIEIFRDVIASNQDNRLILNNSNFKLLQTDIRDRLDGINDDIGPSLQLVLSHMTPEIQQSLRDNLTNRAHEARIKQHWKERLAEIAFTLTTRSEFPTRAADGKYDLSPAILTK